jgi:hypothetical protein
VWASLRRNVFYAVNSSLAKAAAHAAEEAAASLRASSLRDPKDAVFHEYWRAPSSSSAAAEEFKVVGGDVFVLIKLQGADAGEVRKAARRLNAQQTEVLIS